MKNFSDTTGNLTRDLPVCSSVSQATASQSGLNPRRKSVNYVTEEKDLRLGR